ncbi:SRPBCC family protein [Neobacillus niacini]|uniref:SRPBCC family protein n=1 Tax=Neobacillus niacini TaxID=86668 RepID=UPI00203AA1BE|nr:SRPBCC family protein [Neobacillus niacini]MCM3694150.1 SRPBCC family protein [Neobacillus niacini]
MKEWTKEIEIDAPIEKIWALFDGSLENMQKIMPQVISNTPVKVTEEGVGTIYRQQYKEGKRVEEYDVETLVYLDTPDHKKMMVGFNLANYFEITAGYELTKINEHKSHFKYTTTNKPLKAIFKLFLWFASDKTVVKFVEKVKAAAEEEHALVK